MRVVRFVVPLIAFIATLAYIGLPGGKEAEPEVAGASHAGELAPHPLLAPTSKCGNQTNTSLSASDQERVMRCMHNYARNTKGLRALAADSRLRDSSNLKSRDILDCDEFSHTACGRDMVHHIRKVGYNSGASCWGAAENIAWGSGSHATVREIMNGWLYSDGHRTNILNRRYRDVGVGLRVGELDLRRSGGPRVTDAHVWTGHFGYRGC